MKKLFLASVISLATISAFAQAMDQAQMDVSVVVAQDDFSEIAINELPEAVTAAVAKNYPSSTIDKAYVNKAKQYKLEVSLEDGTKGTLYADENGEWIEL